MTPNPHRLAAIGVGIIVMGMAVGIVAGLFALELPEGNREVALVILGTAIGWAGSVVNYHFGSSSGSARKTDMLAEKAGEQGKDEA